MTASRPIMGIVTGQYPVSVRGVASLGSADDTDHRAGSGHRERPLRIKAGIEQTGEGGLNGAV